MLSAIITPPGFTFSIIKSKYKSFEKFYKDTTITPYLEKNERELLDFFKLVEYTNLYASIIHLDDNDVIRHRLVKKVIAAYKAIENND